MSASHSHGKTVVALFLGVILTVCSVVPIFVLRSPPHIVENSQSIVFSSYHAVESPRLNNVGNQIVFSADISGTFQIWSILSDGQHLTQLTSLDGKAKSPIYSPDGSNIAFYHASSKSNQIMIMGSTGLNLKIVSGNDNADDIFSWSPNSLSLAYQATNRSTNEVVVLSSSDWQPVFRAQGSYPTWNQVGNELAFITVEEGKAFLSIENFENQNSSLIALNSAQVTWPRFIANDTMIAFLSEYNDTWRLMTVSLSSNQIGNMLTSPEGQYNAQSLHPILTENSIAIPSPTNTSEIMFCGYSAAPRNMDLFSAVLNATIVVSHFFNIDYPGTLITRLTNQSYLAIGPPSWSNDGTKIVFSGLTSSRLYDILLISYVPVVVQPSSYGG